MEQHPDQWQGAQPGHVSLQQVSAKEFAAKFHSKRECYNFLAGECEVYLPPYGKSLSDLSTFWAGLISFVSFP